MRRTITGAAVAAMLLSATAPLAATSPADRCEASKNKTAGAYYSCRAKAEATAISNATTPDYSKCSARFDDKWGDAESSGAGACPGVVLTGPMNTYIANQAAEAASVIAGATIPSCEADLATCLGDCVASVRPQLRTGQTLCYNSAGAGIACQGTGQDGELQRGAAHSFTDNGNGTISDNTTGLMWEKQSDDGTIHDKDNDYTWDGRFDLKIAALNSTVFAGHDDWRLPNLNELESLRSLAAVSPATFGAFNAACSADCTIASCSCTRPGYYWSSSTYQGNPSGPLYVNFYDGMTHNDGEIYSGSVRAVRGGS